MKTLVGGALSSEKTGLLDKLSDKFVKELDIKGIRGYKNNTTQKVVLAKSYTTTANGIADEVAVMPGETIVQVKQGDAWSFARYIVF